MEKIRWSREEATAVASAALTFWKTAPGMTMLEAVRGGQNTLPKERRRKMATLQQVNPTTKFLLDKAVKGGELEEKKPEPPAAPPVEPPKPVVLALEAALHELADLVADTVSDRLAAKLHQSLAQRMEGILQHAAQQAVHSDVQRKRKVLIIGLAGYLQYPIQQEFAKALDLRFKEPNAPAGGIVDVARSMDLVIQTKWSSHSIGDTLRSAGIEPVFIDGGVQAIKDKLTEFYALN